MRFIYLLCMFTCLYSLRKEQEVFYPLLYSSIIHNLVVRDKQRCSAMHGTSPCGDRKNAIRSLRTSMSALLERHLDG